LHVLKKTNALRLLEEQNIPHRSVAYTYTDEDLNAAHIALDNGLDPAQLFKTLVLQNENNQVLVALIPSDQNLNLKALAQCSNSKKVQMVAVKDLLNLTGYIRGGCSPIGMKKTFPVFLDETAVLWPEIFINAGAKGLLIGITPDDFCRACGAVIWEL
jgi:Cys-tRNA(Pro)/Cys-tRNA(Cys) deacylase